MQYHSKKHHKERRAIFGDSSSDIANGIFNVMIRACVAQTNQGQPYSARVNMTSVDSNVFTDTEAPPTDPDCMFCHVLHWGKTEQSQKVRDNLATELHQIALRYWDKTRYPDGYASIDEVVYWRGDFMKQFEGGREDFDTLVRYQESCHPLRAPTDYRVWTSERTISLERSHFFLGSSDSDYHSPPPHHSS